MICFVTNCKLIGNYIDNCLSYFLNKNAKGFHPLKCDYLLSLLIIYIDF